MSKVLNYVKRLKYKGPAENAMVATISLGTFMLLQPFFLGLFTYSFIVILAGTLGFVVVSHFPEEEER
ncbi:hypothetical protein EXU34_16390 [Alteromonas sp. ZYF713]|nr:hypothetical protein [Alteromonas sp. ZYF713]